MKFAAFSVVLFLIGTASAVPAQVTVAEELTLAAGVQEHAGLDEVYKRFSKAYRDLDADAFAEIYTPSAAYLVPGQEVQIGLDGIAANFARFFNSVRQRDARLTISFEIVQRKVIGPMAYDVGIYTIRTFDKEDAQIGLGKGKFVVVALREDGSWKFQVDGFSAMPANNAEAAPTIDSFAWLAGCWERSVPERKLVITEQWMKPAGGTIHGMSRTVADGRTTDWEYLRIAPQGQGLAYIAKPKANAEETAFALKSVNAAEAVFENLQHDFPQRIMYRRQGSDSLTARIEGMRNGQVNGKDFVFRRVACD